eukprot:TRINITY_DN201_c0_g1_i19.p3 TRINITY_DN201_c0_g1~~TRINITY_DN201_c0_g1_i19.p3  ORF type:complete len:308 (+),score=43.39 TRINITY_DN201_c0_g1_i19:183-1106(+)
MIGVSYFDLFILVVFFSTVIQARLLIDDTESSSNQQQLRDLMLWGNYAYYVSSSPATYEQASQICANADASLVRLETPYESFTLARRFAGSDFGDHSKNAFTAVDWSASDVPTKMAFWIGNSPSELSNMFVSNTQTSNVYLQSSYKSAGLTATLSDDGCCCAYLESTKFERNGVWRNDEPCESVRMHFVCKKDVEQITKEGPSTHTLFASLTLDCAVSPDALSVTHVYKNEEEGVLMAFVPYPSKCDLKGMSSSTGVVAIDVTTVPMPVRFYIVDPSRKFTIPFENGVMNYVGSMDDVLIGQVSQIM